VPTDADHAYNDVPPVLDAGAVARLFGVVPRVAARWLCDGTIPSKKVGKKRFALREDVLGLLRARRDPRAG
jgi:hypothetical protein